MAMRARPCKTFWMTWGLHVKVFTTHMEQSVIYSSLLSSNMRIRKHH